MSEGFSSPTIRPHATEEFVSLVACAVFAVAIHAGIFYAWNPPANETEIIEVQGDSVEVALVEAAGVALEPAPEAPAPPPALPPAAEAPAPSPLPPPPTPPPPIPEPIPEPLPIPPRAEPPPIALPPEVPPVAEVRPPVPVSPPEPVPLPKEELPAPPLAETPPPVAKLKSVPVAAKVAQANKATEGNASKGASAGVVGDASGKSLGKPLYLVRPQVNYPAESRAAGEQGTVLLRITVNANGRPTAVSVTTSSGFSRLDRAAVEGGWRCRVSNAFDGAQFEAPLRFSLQDR